MTEITQEAEKVEGQKTRSFREMLLYKMDRTIAIFGIVAIGFVAVIIYSTKNADSLSVALAAISGLTGYIGGRAVGAAKKEG